VLNKCDIAGVAPGVERDPCGTITAVRVSALTGAGCAALRDALAERFALEGAATPTISHPARVGL
jgi:GTP-binding protein HflX